MKAAASWPPPDAPGDGGDRGEPEWSLEARRPRKRSISKPHRDHTGTAFREHLQHGRPAWLSEDRTASSLLPFLAVKRRALTDVACAHPDSRSGARRVAVRLETTTRGGGSIVNGQPAASPRPSFFSLLEMRRSTTARDYGATHQATRKRLQGVIDAGGVACARCGCPILPGMDWHLDHAPGKTSYLGPRTRSATSPPAGGREPRSRTLAVTPISPHPRAAGRRCGFGQSRRMFTSPQRWCGPTSWRRPARLLEKPVESCSSSLASARLLHHRRGSSYRRYTSHAGNGHLGSRSATP